MGKKLKPGTRSNWNRSRTRLKSIHWILQLVDTADLKEHGFRGVGVQNSVGGRLNGKRAS